MNIHEYMENHRHGYDLVKEAIKQVATKMGISENVIITILEHEYEKVNKRKK